MLFALAIALIFFYAPTDANQGLSQKIFYFHVPIALTAYACFGWGAWKALRHLWKRDADADLESYVAIHQGVIFGSLTLLTGSIWARISWGVWWVWGDDELVLFLVLFLFYCAYFMLRYSVEPGLARANMCAVYALFGVVLIPISFLAIRLSRSIIHPEVFTLQRAADDPLAVPHLLRRAGSRCCSCSRRSTRSSSPGSGSTCSCASSGSCSHDAVREVHRRRVPRRLRRRCSPTSLIIASKLQRLQRQVGELVEKLREREHSTSVAELLFWPALLGYGEAALAYTSPRYTRARDVGSAARLARADRAARRAGGRRRRLPVVDLGRVAQPLRLVRRRRLPDLGLPAALPAARAHGDAARGAPLRRRAGRRRDRRRRALALLEPLPRRSTSASSSPRSPASRSRRRSRRSTSVEERRLKRHSPDILRLRLPSLVVLERLTVRTIAISLPLLTVGLAAGFVRLREQRRRRSTR